MTLPFWTKEKKQDYLDLYKQREQQRKYNREYMQKARNEGKYKYYSDGAKIKYKNLQKLYVCHRKPSKSVFQ